MLQAALVKVAIFLRNLQCSSRSKLKPSGGFVSFHTQWMEMAVAGGGAGGKDEEAQGGEVVAVASTTGRRLMDFIPIYIPTVEEGLLEDAPRERRLLDFLKARPSRDWFVHLGFVAGRIPSFSSSIRPRITNQEGDGGSRRFRVLFVRKINWSGMARYAKNWVKKPKHMALLVWLAAVAAGLLLMLLVASGALNHSIPKSSRRKRWLEIDNQILNALFTIMCIYEHPKLVHHLVLLVRWSAKDVAELRRLYSRKGVARRGERGHMVFVLSLLHITCLSQYALCGLYWGYNRHNRPDVGENLCLAVGRARRRRGVRRLRPVGQEGGGAAGRRSSERGSRGTGHEAGGEAGGAEPAGGGDEAGVGGGPLRLLRRPRRGVPLLLLHLLRVRVEHGAAGLRQHVRAHRHLPAAGRLPRLGLHRRRAQHRRLGDAAGRADLRRRALRLRPPLRRLLANPDAEEVSAAGQRLLLRLGGLTDCFQWLLCWTCSLAQEVRTGNFYDVEEDSFYRKGGIPSSPEEEEERSITPVFRQLRDVGSWGPAAAFPVVLLESPARSYSCPPEVGAAVMNVPFVGSGKVADCEDDHVVVMAAPVPPLIGRVEEGEQQGKHSTHHEES